MPSFSGKGRATHITHPPSSGGGGRRYRVDKTTEEIITRGFNLLEAVCEKIGVTIDYLWPYFIRQQIVEAIVPLLFLVVGIVLAIVCYKQLMSQDIFKNYDLTAKGGIWIALSIATFICLFISAVEFATNLSGLLNPQYSAIQDLVKMVKP